MAAHRRPFLIDTDTASDDAVALIMALRDPDVQVHAVTIVSGNVPLEQAARNARFTAELCGRDDVPIHLGAARPLKREPFDAKYFHGNDGLGDAGYAPAARFSPDPEPAAEAILRHCRRSAADIEIVTLGPLTNIALAIQADPDAMRAVKRCVVMGGNPWCVGNVTPAAEYNIWCDPEAASIVFRSGMNLEMVGWQLSRGVYALNAEEIDLVRRAIGTPYARFAIECNRVAERAFERQTGQRGIGLPDPVAMAVALDPSIITSASDHLVEIETTSDLTRGETIVDQLNGARAGVQRLLWPPDARRARIVWEIDAPRWKAMLYRALR
jgi:purine nucleosidase